MSTLASKISDVQAALDTLARQHKVPGASLGILHGDEVVEFATGVANINTGVPVTTKTLFQIGSNTKLLTATLIMQLVDDGLVDLDTPVKKYLPGLRLGDRKALDTVTVRMLLNHSSGIEGDYFEGFGRGDDAVEKFVDALGPIGNIYRPGEMWSYCNTGWNILGRIVEVIREAPYAWVVDERIFKPLQMATSTVLMEHMLMHSCAVGHVIMPGTTEPVVPPVVMMSPSHAPAGSMTVSTPAQLLAFCRMHINLGVAKDGTRVLSESSAKAMQQASMKMPYIPGLGTQMGLGWMLDEWDGERVLGHGGNTIGQGSYLKVLPDRPFAATLFTNSTSGGALWQDMARYIFGEFAGVHPTENPKVPATPPKVDLKKYTGTYGRLGLRLDLTLTDGKLQASLGPEGDIADLADAQAGLVQPIDPEIFMLNISGQQVVIHFTDFDKDGRPKYAHAGARVSKRLPEAKAKAKAKPKASSKKRAKKK